MKITAQIAALEQKLASETGKVKWFRHDGTGYLIPDAEPHKTLYFDKSVFEGNAGSLERGTSVEFERGKGRLHNLATMVRLKPKSQKSASGYNEYKKEHPGTQKTPGDFHPAYGEVKPHLSHDDMVKLSPREHKRLAKEHQAHAQTASTKAGEARRSGDKEQNKIHRDLNMKHGDMSLMHDRYDLARTGSEDLRPGMAAAAKKRHEELSA